MRNIYIASYCENGGIYHYQIDLEGKPFFRQKYLLDRPMYLYINGNRLYALLRQPFSNSTFSGLVSYAINADGNLSDQSPVLSTLGEAACHLTVDGDHVYVVNYLSGSVIKMPDQLITHRGKGVHPVRQTGPHTHFICATPDKKYLCVTDLGLDKIYVYDKKLSHISEVKLISGSGPRHIAFSSDHKLAYCANELSSTVSVLRYENGRFEHITSYSTLPADFKGENCPAAIRTFEDRVFVSNRGHNSIASFKIDNDKLRLTDTVDCGGDSPRDFLITGNLLICANEKSDNTRVFFLDSDKSIMAIQDIPIERPYCVIAM